MKKKWFLFTEKCLLAFSFIQDCIHEIYNDIQFYILFAAGSDPEYFVDLTEVEKSLVAVVVGNTYSSEEIEIKVRRCPDGFHYYLKPPKTRPAVYCFGELFSSCIYIYKTSQNKINEVISNLAQLEEHMWPKLLSLNQRFVTFYIFL